MNSLVLDQTLRDGIDRGAAAGAVAAVLDHTGVQWTGAAGETAFGDGNPIAVDTAFALHSMTKSVVSIAALRLVEQGELSLDAPASTWCPWLADVHVLDGTDATGAPRLRPPATVPTLRHLLTHTSGFAYPIWDAELAAWMAHVGHSPSLLTRSSLQTPLVFDPGTEWQYGIGIDWTGLVIEAATGETLGEHLQNTILRPLEMHDTTFHPDEDLRNRLSARHQRLDDGTLTVLDGDPPINGEFEMGGGGLYGTVPDFCRFLLALVRGGTTDGVRILGEDSLHRWGFRNQIGDLRVRELRSTNRQLSQHAKFFPGDPKGHSLVGQVNLIPAHTGRSAGTLAWAGMANCYFWVDPVASIAGVFASRLLPFADPEALGLALDIERVAYAGG